MKNNVAHFISTPKGGLGGDGFVGYDGGHGTEGLSFGVYCFQTKLKDTNSCFNTSFAAQGGLSQTGQLAESGEATEQMFVSSKPQ